MRQFEEFYREEYPAVFRATLVFCGNRELAQDTTQEAFSRALARWQRLSKNSWAGGWVMTTSFNLCRKQLRRRLARSATSAPSQEIDIGGRLDIIDALRRLPDRQRQAVILFYLTDHPVSAVADLMGISDGAVKSHLSRAREALKGSLEVADA